MIAVHMEWKLFWSLFGASLSVCAAVIPTLLGVEWWITAAAVGVVALAGLMFTARVVHTADMFKPLDLDGKNRVAIFARLGVGAYALWVVLFVINPAMWPVLALSMAALVIAVYWAARGIEWWVKRAKPKVQPVEAPTNSAYADLDVVRRFRPIVDKAGHSRVKITQHTVVIGDSGEREANQFLLQIPASGSGK